MLSYNSRQLGDNIRAEIRARDGACCQYCNKQLVETDIQIDHVVPFCCGGSKESWNLVVSCRACNITKRDKVWRPNNFKKLCNLPNSKLNVAMNELHYAEEQERRNEKVVGSIRLSGEDWVKLDDIATKYGLDGRGEAVGLLLDLFFLPSME